MASGAAAKRFDATSARLASAGLGAALGVTWVVALASGATPWLTWFVALAALACLGAVSLVPEGRPGLVAAGDLGFVAAGLVACWIVALATRATAWLAWLCFGFALLAGVVAFAAAVAALLDHPSFFAWLKKGARAAVGADRAKPSTGR